MNEIAPVLVIFWKRIEPFQQVINQIRKVKPSTLLFYQDGPRNTDDINDIMQCRKLIEQIDWDCQINTHFNEHNIGCDPNVYNAIKWAFSNVDKCIILEDDCIVDETYFRFATELLEKYESNEKINMICSLNVEQESYIKEDYFYCKRGNTWGWATWKRVIDNWNDSYEAVNQPELLKGIRKQFPTNSSYKHYIKRYKQHAKQHIAYHEYINSMQQYTHDQFNIIPRCNMVENVGTTKDATHFTSDIKLLSKDERKIMKLRKQSISFPLVHPKTICNNAHYDKKLVVDKYILLRRKLERGFLKVRHKVLSFKI